MATFSELVNNPRTRMEVFVKLSLHDRIKISSMIERYNYLTKVRANLFGSLYGSKAHQAKDDKLKGQQEVIRDIVSEKLNGL